MIIQFTFSNFLSFKDKYTLDMTAINSYKEHSYNLIDIGQKEKFIKVAAIYGANASGKSNLFFAFKYFQSIVRKSFNNSDKDNRTILQLCYNPFRFDKDSNNTEFEIIEFFDGAEYRYGFEYNDKEIVAEWLYKKDLSTKRQTMFFEREYSEINLGASIRKECSLYKDQIPKETLVLSFFNKLKLKTNVFNIVYSEIMLTLAIPSEMCESKAIIDNSLPTIIDSQKKKLLSFLNAIDTGIKDIYYENESQNSEPQFFTTHLDQNGNEYSLEFFNESEGTIKCINIFIYIQSAIQHGKSLFIDELNVKLHPLLVKFIIDLFYEENSEAQLIYTTHDTTLLDKKFFRRDQIWFVQKDEFGHSELTALSDFKVRSDASFEKDYLAGVYGGIPLIKDFTMKDGEWSIMGKFEEHRKGRGIRAHEFRTPKANSYLIITEGKGTEPNYFHELRSLILEKVGGNVDVINIPKIEIKGIGQSTGKLIEAVEKTLNKSKIMYQNVWIVFDKDDFIDFDEAIELGQKSGYNIAWSNQSFEYWLFLHFNYSDAALHRNEWIEKLNCLFKQFNLNGGKYSKTCKNIYSIMDKNDGVNNAIKNAKKRMLNFNPDENKPSEYDPGTTVYKLVEDLIEYLKD